MLPNNVSVCERLGARTNTLAVRRALSLVLSLDLGFGICVYVWDFYDFQECYVRENYIAPHFGSTVPGKNSAHSGLL